MEPGFFKNHFQRKRNLIFRRAGLGVLCVGILCLALGASPARSPVGGGPFQAEVPSSPAESYTLQLNSFKNESNARKFFQALKKKGIAPYVVITGTEDIWYKIRLGPFPSRREAVKRAKELHTAHGLSSFVVRSESFTSPASVFPKIPPPEKKSFPGKTAGSHPPPSDRESLNPENAGNSVDVVFTQFLIWLQAMQDNDLDVYFSFYSENFESEGKSYKEWVKVRRKFLEKNKGIKIEVDDVEMQTGKDTIEMSFIQNFQSGDYSGVQHRVLVWKKEGGQWKIILESTKPA